MTAKRDSTNTVASLEPAIKLRTATITGRVDHWFFCARGGIASFKTRR